MDFVSLKEDLKDVAITTVTPFSNNLSEINTVGIEKNLSFLMEEGARVVVPCGNTGEFYSLSEDEWNQVVEATINAVNNRMKVVAGVGHSISTAMSQIQQVIDLSADAVMIMYPQHVFTSEEGVLEYYRHLLDSAKNIGVVLYKKGPLLTDAVLSKLKRENLVCVKYAHGRIVDFARTVQNLGTDIVWSCGTAERFTPFFWLAGARAITSGLANFAPKVSLEMLNALSTNDYEKAMKIQSMITPFEYLREGRGKANNVPVVKAVMDQRGLVGGDCRPPIHPLSDEERRDAIDAVAKWNE